MAAGLVPDAPQVGIDRVLADPLGFSIRAVKTFGSRHIILAGRTHHRQEIDVQRLVQHADAGDRVNLSQADGVAEDPKSASHLRHPAPLEGALAIVTDVGRDAVDALATQDERR